MKGYFLPNISFEEKEQQVGKLSLAFPDLAPTHLIDIADRLIDAQEKLAEESIFKIVDWIDQAAAQWLDPKGLVREEAESIIPPVSGISREMLRVILDDLFNNFTRPVLIQFLEEELGDPRQLDRFCQKKRGVGFTRAFGPRLIAQILPGNVTGLSVTSLICGLLAKSANIAKVSREEVLFPVLFARTLHDIWPEMAGSIGISAWDNEAETLTETLLQKADLAVVYGSDETIATIREKIPATTSAVFYGHRLSLGMVARESIGKDIADQIAIDIALYDQNGCLSPHLYYVESGGDTSPQTFAQWVAQSLCAISLRLPKGEVLANQAVQIQQLRESLPLRGGTVFQSPFGLDWTVLYDVQPEFNVSPLSRTVWIKPVQDLSGVGPYLDPYRKSIQAIGVALPEERQADLIPKIARMGACRICPIGKMQTPPMTWHHEGRFRLLPLLRFVDWENS
ncbi:hypothetical protein JYT87_00735 [Nitrospira defluvii]|nr:hypothetical protein [Nitrospira defluvii]